MTGPLEYFLHWESIKPGAIAFRQPTGSNWRTRTYQQAGNEIRRIAAYLKSLELPPHSHIAILSKNCTEWILADLAIMMAGHVSIPLYATLSGEGIQPVIEHSDTRAIFIGKLDNYADQRSGIPEGIHKISISCYGVDDGTTWEEIVERTPPLENPPMLKAEDVLTIIYTSGTTGRPKGVVHTVNNFDGTVKKAQQEVHFPNEPRVFSYLPLSHIAERLGVEFVGLYQGAEFSFPESLDTFPTNLFDTQPDYFIAVPRIWSKFQEKVLEKMPQSRLDVLLAIPLVNTIIKKAIRNKMGLGNCKLYISGAAPLSKSIMEWYDRLGMTIYQVLGMTEDCVYAHFNRPGANKFGTVGKPMEGLQVKLTDDGELRVKHDYLMKGYYKDPELTAAMFDEEGYLKTGDAGEIDSEGYLTITGRVKDQFKTDKGKYISPAPIEMKLMKNTDIEQVCVVGMGVPQPIVLTVLSSNGKAKTKDAIERSITATLNEVNEHLESHEKLATAVIMKGEWTIENGMMTPSMKLKRNEIEKLKLPRYPEWYHHENTVVWE